MAVTKVNAETTAKTQSFSRMICISNQFILAFQRLMGYSETEYKKYIDAITMKKVSSISFWAYKYDQTGKRKKWVELILKVDWEMHNNYLLRGESAVELKKKWNGALPEISVAIGDIQSFMEDNQLRAAFTVYFVPDLDRIELNRYMDNLNLTPHKEVDWRDETESISGDNGMVSLYRRTPREAPEISAELRVSKEIW